MDPVAGLLLFVLTVCAMEAVAWSAHRWVMHGPGWFLHRDHHQRRGGRLERNDLYAVLFALPSVALLWAGTSGRLGDWATWTGAGIAAYGLLYFLFHDVLVHRRIGHRWSPARGYLARIVRAHRIHHATAGRDGARHFGFLFVRGEPGGQLPRGRVHRPSRPPPGRDAAAR
jgi:beta-carotene 3-hydroxylase